MGDPDSLIHLPAPSQDVLHWCCCCLVCMILPMERIRHKVSSYPKSKGKIEVTFPKVIRKSPGHIVKTYRDLIKKLAELAFENPEFVLFMRGQNKDFCADTGTTLFPTMYRDSLGSETSDKFYYWELKDRYEELEKKERMLYKLFGVHYRKRVSRSKMLRWAILQHYEICPTPLLDVTQSARVAASFAFEGALSSRDYVYLYVLGLPQIHGSITVVSEQALQIVRLTSVCPPTTLRPYFQEGYLLGTYPPVDTLFEKGRYARSEMDCANRLIAKFRLKKVGFWDDEFQPLGNSALYPEESNSVNQKILELRQD